MGYGIFFWIMFLISYFMYKEKHYAELFGLGFAFVTMFLLLISYTLVEISEKIETKNDN